MQDTPRGAGDRSDAFRVDAPCDFMFFFVVEHEIVLAASAVQFSEADQRASRAGHLSAEDPSESKKVEGDIDELQRKLNAQRTRRALPRRIK